MIYTRLQYVIQQYMAMPSHEEHRVGRHLCPTPELLKLLWWVELANVILQHLLQFPTQKNKHKSEEKQVLHKEQPQIRWTNVESKIEIERKRHDRITVPSWRCGGLGRSCDGGGETGEREGSIVVIIQDHAGEDFLADLVPLEPTLEKVTPSLKQVQKYHSESCGCAT